MTYRSDVDALAARTDALAVEVRTKTAELETARSLLDEAKAKAKLPVLPNIRVATPCPADWNAMTGDERTRACGACNKNVYNLSTLTREEAEALILEKEGRLCVRYFQRKDGTILLKDCSIGITQKRKRRVLAVGIAALLGGGVFAAFKLTRPAPGTGNSAFDLPASLEDVAMPMTQMTTELNEYSEVKGGMSAEPEAYPRMGAVAVLPHTVDPPAEGTKLPNGNVVVE
jgi:hypothetical protein